MQNGTLLAAVDLGSNSFRCEIGRLSGPQIVRADYLKETVRLGAGLDERGWLTEPVMARALACLERFAERVRDFKPEYVRAVATQTVREAQNRAEFLRRAEQVLRFPVELISGREEARLIYSGVAHLLPSSSERRLVIDIGGRSTELILGSDLVPGTAESYRVGSVSLSQRYFSDGRFTERAFEQARIAAAAAFEESIEVFGRAHWDVAYGSSGTVGAIADLLAANTLGDGEVTRDGLAWCRERMVKAGSVERLRVTGLKDDRKAVLGGGLAVLEALFDTFELDCLNAARGALRHGVLFDLVGRQAPGGEDLRHMTVERLRQDFRADAAQARRVEDACVALYRMLQPEPDDERLAELQWAARLHEIGMAVSHSEYHRHGAYIIEKADAAGFSQSQQQLIANLVLGHRGGLRKIEVLTLDRSFTLQLIALRLGSLLCHARRTPSTPNLRLRREQDRIWVELASAWAAEHPQSLHLLREEVEIWRRMPMHLRLVDSAGDDWT
ncbi:MAG: Ppx/GppA family phosphatase [Betaproteobacteria bacterium]|nr:Ppx/GppA family phosphatase [Betaproteobacteria bacterium]